MANDEGLEALLEVTKVLDTLGVEYLIAGSLASSFHGIPRSTLDADLVADLKPAHVRPLIDALQSKFYLDERRIRDAVSRRSSFNVIFLRTMFKVDVFVLKEDPLSQEEMSRRQRVVLDEEAATTIEIATAEDTVLQKLIWFRAGGGVSGRQWEDLLGVLKVRRNELDLAYLKQWATQLQLEELLFQALEEAGIEPATG